MLSQKKKEKNELLTMCCHRALAQLAPPPLASAKWRVRSWVQDLPGTCITYQLKIKIKMS